MAKIILEGMTFYAYHGCYKEEQKIGTRFEVDCILEYDATAAALHDDLQMALDYQQIYRIIKEQMTVRSSLLEQVAWRLIQNLHSHLPALRKVTLTISKVQPAIGGDVRKVSVMMDSDEMA
ncbi:MAG: dihydroneopterin aldolase [Bacteroidales bacterium]|nr:dihydroneopterin aldolase [Bacteroidales bacterium]MCR5190723.1 dihydroneopterin aldolase [Bacteroidales bacterium]